MYSKNSFRKTESRSSTGIPARADMQQRYTLERTVKVLDGWNLRSTDARRPLELETQDSARAPSPPLERIVKQCRDAGCSNSPLERHLPRSSGRAKSGNPRLHLQAQTQVLTTQNSTSWAEFPENICKHIVKHDSKLNLRNQSPRVFNSNPISNHFHEHGEHANMHEFKSLRSSNLVR